MKSKQELKAEIYKRLNFTAQEIAEGERLYKSLGTQTAVDNFAEFYNVYRPGLRIEYLRKKSISEGYGNISNSTRVAIINLAAKDYGGIERAKLANSLFHSPNNVQLEGTQDLYDVACWWIEFEQDYLVKTRLVATLINYTAIREDAKGKIIELIGKDGDVVTSLQYWLKNKFPRPFDAQFGKRVLQEIDKCRPWAEQIAKVTGFEAVRRSFGLAKKETPVDPKKMFWLKDIANYSNYSHEPLYELQKFIDIQIVETHVQEDPRSDYEYNSRLNTQVIFNHGDLIGLHGPFVYDDQCKFLCCTLSWIPRCGVAGLIIIDLSTKGEYYGVGQLIGKTSIAATAVDFKDNEFIVLVGGGDARLGAEGITGGEPISYKRNGYQIGIKHFPEFTVTKY